VAEEHFREFVSRFASAKLWWLDDDRQLCRLVRPRLLACGWQLRVFHTAADLQLALQSSRPDLLLLDQRLKDRQGTDLLHDLRQLGETFPVLILSGLSTAEDRIFGLEHGAQDYLVKPFHLRELQLRIEQLLQRDRRAMLTPAPSETQIPLGALTFCPHQGCLQRPGATDVLLTRGESVLLLALCRAPGRILSRTELALASGSLTAASSSRSIDMRLSRLRRLLEQASGGALRIEAVRSQGYALQIGPPSPEDAPP